MTSCADWDSTSTCSTKPRHHPRATDAPGQALRLALVVERRARVDATTWVQRRQDQTRLVARGHTDQIIELAKTTDPLRTALSPEWYVQVYQEQLGHDLSAADPAIAVTPVETEHVAECLRVGVAYRIHGPGGWIVLDADSPHQGRTTTPTKKQGQLNPPRPTVARRSLVHRTRSEEIDVPRQ